MSTAPAVIRDEMGRLADELGLRTREATHPELFRQSLWAIQDALVRAWSDGFTAGRESQRDNALNATKRLLDELREGVRVLEDL